MKLERKMRLTFSGYRVYRAIQTVLCTSYSDISLRFIQRNEDASIDRQKS